MASPHLARARAAEREVRTAVLDEPVDLVEKLGHLLHFIYDDEAPTTLGGDLLPQELQSSDVADQSLERPAKRAAPGIARQREPQAGDVAQEDPQGDTLRLGRGRHQPDRHAT